MPFSDMNLKKTYYYVICAMAFFVLMWGCVDLASSSIGLYNIRGAEQLLSAPGPENAITPEKGDQFFDTYYQKKMLQDRFYDSLARILISGVIFVYCRFTVNRLEQQA